MTTVGGVDFTFGANATMINGFTFSPWAFQTSAYNNYTTGANTGAVWPWNTYGATTNVTQTSWNSWNTAYEFTAEQARAILLIQSVAQMRAYGCSEVENRSAEALLRVLLRVPDLTPSEDEERVLTDAYDRSFEESLERRRQDAIIIEEKVIAGVRAEALLISLLSQEQKEEWTEHQRVTEIAADSGRVWRFLHAWGGGTTIMEGEVRRLTLCIHPAERVPEADVIAGLLLAVRAGEEDRLIKVANLHQGSWSEDELAIRRGQKAERQRAVVQERLVDDQFPPRDERGRFARRVG